MPGQGGMYKLASFRAFCGDTGMVPAQQATYSIIVLKLLFDNERFISRNY
jgi:hypothetical protein